MKRLLLLGLLLMASSEANAYIEWTQFQYTVESGHDYEMAVAAGWSVASSVYVFKEGAFFASDENEYGTAYAGNVTTDYGNQTVHYTANGYYDRTADWGYWDSDSSSFEVTIVQPNHPPIVNWTQHPDSVGVNEWFNVQSRGDDDDGNLASVIVWKEWVAFAVNGGGNGYESFSDTNGASLDHPGSITYQTQAQDSNGAQSAVIFHTVYVNNNAPSVTGTAASIYVGQTATVSWSASDPNGNLSYVNVWVTRWGSPYWDDLGSGGAIGSKTWSGSAHFNPANPATGSYLFVIRAVDSEGAYTDAYATFDVINRAPDSPTISSGGVTQINLGQSISLTGTLHDSDGNLAYHDLFYAAPSMGWVELLPGTPSNGTSSSLSTSFIPTSLGTWQFLSNGHDGYAWGPGATLSVSVVDGTPPSAPGGLASSSVTSASFTLSWSASSDNVGVTLYEVSRNSVSLGTTAGTSMPIIGLSGSTTYQVSVRARDAANNWSAWSSALPVSTSATPAAPVITAHPQNQSLIVGNTASFSVSATGTATLTYQWRKNSAPISGATSATYSISNVQTSHAGNYDVVVTNGVGSATSNAATLTVSPATQTDTANQNLLNLHLPLSP